MLDVEASGDRVYWVDPSDRERAVTARLSQLQHRNVTFVSFATPEADPEQDLQWPILEIPVEQSPPARSPFLDDFKLDERRSRG